MLDEMKSMYQQQADLIPGWKDMTKSELCNLYIQNENDEYLKSCYFSAILLKYWSKIYSLQSNTYLTASYDDVYNWIVDSILYALKNRRWLCPDSHIYGDPNGPDKAINRRIKCTRINHLISSNRDKRQVHINLLSLDQFEDSDNFISRSSGLEDDTVFDLVTEYWECGLYLQAIIIDIIASGDCYEKDEFTGEETFNYSLLVVGIANSLKDEYAEYFADRYELSLEDVENRIYEILTKSVGEDLWGFGDFSVDRTMDEISKDVATELAKLSANNNLKEMLK